MSFSLSRASRASSFVSLLSLLLSLHPSTSVTPVRAFLSPPLTSTTHLVSLLPFHHPFFCHRHHSYHPCLHVIILSTCPHHLHCLLHHGSSYSITMLYYSFLTCLHCCCHRNCSTPPHVAALLHSFHPSFKHLHIHHVAACHRFVSPPLAPNACTDPAHLKLSNSLRRARARASAKSKSLPTTLQHIQTTFIDVSSQVVEFHAVPTSCGDATASNATLSQRRLRACAIPHSPLPTSQHTRTRYLDVLHRVMRMRDLLCRCRWTCLTAQHHCNTT